MSENNWKVVDLSPRRYYICKKDGALYKLIKDREGVKIGDSIDGVLIVKTNKSGGFRYGNKNVERADFAAVKVEQSIIDGVTDYYVWRA